MARDHVEFLIAQDMPVLLNHVRSTPESGRILSASDCPLLTQSGHSIITAN